MNTTDDEIWFDKLRNPQSTGAETGRLSDAELDDAKVLGIALSEQVDAYKNEFILDEEKTQRYLFELKKRDLLTLQVEKIAVRKIAINWKVAIAAAFIFAVISPILYLLVSNNSSPENHYYGLQVVEQRIQVLDPESYSATMMDELKLIATQVEREKVITQLRSQQVVFWSLKGVFKDPPDKKTRQFIKRYNLDRKKMHTTGSSAIFELKLVPK